MPQPPKYNRQKDFAVDYGNETDHAALNAEFDRAATSIDGIRKNLALIQRDDGKLVQGVVTADSVDADFADELSGKVSSGVQGALDDAQASALSATLAANAAETSRNASASSATSSATSASAAASSASSAALSLGNSTTKAGEAAASAASAAASKDAAAASAAGAASSATNAAVAATNADLSKNNAATSASNAATSATNSANSALAAAASAQMASTTYDTFDDRFLGAKANDPALDNDGQSLQTGAMYWRTTSNEMRIWTGTAWQTATPGVPVDGSVTTAKLANGVLSADAAGRAKMADTFLSADAAGRNKMAAKFVSQDKIDGNVATTGPAFSVHNSATGQSLSSGSISRVIFGTEEFDVGSCFASNRYTPNVPGFYRFDWTVNIVGALTIGYAELFRNGGGYWRGHQLNVAGGAGASCIASVGSALIYLNGVSDFAEIWVFATGTTPIAQTSRFSGCLVRAA